MEEFFIFLETIDDPRQEWKIRHLLKDIVAIVLFAHLAGVNDWEEIEAFAEHNEKILKKYLELPNGTPSHDTMQRVFSLIKPEVFQNLFSVWNEMLNSNDGEKLKTLLCIDGKTIKGNGNKNQSPLHIVSAWAKDGGICLGQKSSDSKGKEIPCIKELLGTLSLKDKIVTIDAIGTQTEIAEKIKCGKGDYVLAVKNNQKNLLEDISLYLNDTAIQAELKRQGNYAIVKEKAHGQIETREYYQTSNISWLYKKENWKGLKTIGCVKTTVNKDGKETVEFRYYISSLNSDISLFEKSVRGHWSVESMHWHLDVTFREDKNRTLEKTAAENLNIIRKLSLSILKTIEITRKNKPLKVLKRKSFKIFLCFEEYLEKLLSL